MIYSRKRAVLTQSSKGFLKIQIMDSPDHWLLNSYSKKGLMIVVKILIGVIIIIHPQWLLGEAESSSLLLVNANLEFISCRPPATRVNDKVMIPQDEYPEINFVGLLIGPR